MAAFGVTVNLVAGTITLPFPNGTLAWGIDSQATKPLKLTFNSPTHGVFGPRILNPHPDSTVDEPQTGDVIDSVGYPFSGPSITITSSETTAQFSSWATTDKPTTNL